MSLSMDAPQPSGHNVIDSLVFTSFGLGLFTYLSKYSAELVTFSAIVSITLGLYRIYRIIEGILKRTKESE